MPGFRRKRRPNGESYTHPVGSDRDSALTQAIATASQMMTPMMAMSPKDFQVEIDLYDDFIADTLQRRAAKREENREMIVEDMIDSLAFEEQEQYRTIFEVVKRQRAEARTSEQLAAARAEYEQLIRDLVSLRQTDSESRIGDIKRKAMERARTVETEDERILRERAEARRDEF